MPEPLTVVLISSVQAVWDSHAHPDTALNELFLTVR
jgi:hypothetical protein